MKKLLTLILSVCMVLSFAPVSFAENITPELSADETVIEAESYGALYAAATADAEYEALDTSSFICSDATASGGSVIKANLSDYAKAYYELKVTAPAAGEYLIEARTTHNQAYGLSGAKFIVNGQETRTIPVHSIDSVWGVFKFKASLTEGENTFRFSGNKAINLAQIWVDYVKFIKEPEAVVVSASDAVKVEAEDYSVEYTLINDTNVTGALPVEIMELDTASGGKYIDTTGIQLTESVNAGPYTTLDIPVMVETDGDYLITSDLFWHTATNTTVCISEYSLFVDGTKVEDYPYPAVTETSVGNWRTRTSIVNLTAGEHTITIRSLVSGRGNKHAALAVDAIEIEFYEPDATVDISETGKTRIEAEEKGVIYAAATADGEYTQLDSMMEYITFDTASSNDEYIKASIKSVAASAYYELKVNAPSAGDYKVTLRAKSTNVNSMKNTVIDINGVETYRLEDGTDTDLKVYTVKVNLNEGVNTIKYKGDTGLYAFYLYIDYIEIEKADYPQIEIIGTTEIEAEDYPYVSLIDANNTQHLVASAVSTDTTFGETFSGEGFIFGNYGSSEVKSVTYELPILVERAGLYDVAVGTKQSATYHASAAVYVNDVMLSGGTSSSINVPVFEEVSQKVLLNEGENVIKVVGTMNSINAMLVVDYIKVTSSVANVPAEIDAEGITLQAEECPVVYKYNAETESYDAEVSVTETNDQGDTYVRARVGTACGNAYYELPVNVETAGKYMLKFRVNKNQSYSLLNGRFAINGVETYVMPTVSDVAGEFCELQVPATFTEGINTVRFLGNAGKSDLYLYVDYVNVRKSIEPVSVSKAEKTRIEAEDVEINLTLKGTKGIWPAIVIEEETLSGGVAIGTKGNPDLDGSESTSPYLTAETVINIEKDGNYRISPSVYWNGIVNTSSYTLFVDGVQYGSYLAVSSDAWTQTSIDVPLSTGEHTVAIKGVGNSVGSTCFAVDYIDIEPQLAVVPAELGEEGVRFEAELNPFVYAYNAETESYDKLQATVTADGIVKCNAGKEVSTSYYELPIEVSVAGDYIVEARVKNTQIYALATGTLAINGVESAVVGAGTDTDLGVYRIKATFTEGENTVRFVGTPGLSAQYIWVDYIKVLPYETVAVSATEETLVEAENHTLSIDTLAYPAAVVEEETLSGGAYLSRSNQQIQALSGKVSSLTVPVTVEKTGYYNITTNTKDHYSGSVCVTSYSLSVDNSKVNTYQSATSEVWTENTTRVFLTEGSHNVTVSSNALYTNVGISVDYIKFEPDISTIPAEVPANGVTFEAEDYPGMYIKAKDAENYEFIEANEKTGSYSGDKAIAFSQDGTGGADIDTAAAYYEFTVKAEAAGDYVVEIAATMQSGAVLKNVKLSVNDVDSGNAVSGGVDEIGKYITTVTLAEGINSIKYKGETGSNSAGEHIHLVVDYINIKAVTENVAVSGTETTKIEAENYSVNQTLLFDDNGDNLADRTTTSNVLAVVEEDETTSSGKYITTKAMQLLDSQLSGPYTTIDIPITVTKAGYYNIASNLNWIFSGTVCVSGYSLIVDGTSVEGYAVPEASGWGLSESVVELSEGDHVITIKSCVINRGNKHAAMAVDYVEITPTVKEGVVYDSETGNATVSVIPEVAGDVVIALYGADGKLVGIDLIEDAQAVATERPVVCTATPVECKVFVWNVETAEPLAAHKDITIE